MAIIGIGLDLIELSRMERSLHRFGEHFLNRIMADDERSAIPGDPASPSARAGSPPRRPRSRRLVRASLKA